jgi:hypothetical protein
MSLCKVNSEIVGVVWPARRILDAFAGSFDFSVLKTRPSSIT